MSISTEKRIAQVTYNGVSIPLAKETWVLNQAVDTATKFSYSKNFTANGVSYSSISVGGLTAPGAGGMVYNLRYGNTTVANSGYFGATDEKNVNRKITFSEPATGELLAWLQANGVKQPNDTIIQDTKALTITSNGTISVTPDAPYDALKKVDVTVNTASSNTPGFKVTFPTTAGNWTKVGQSSVLLLVDGTTLAILDYSTSIAGRTIRNVVGIRCNATDNFHVLKMTLAEGSIAQCAPSAPNSAYAITTSPNVTPTPYAAGKGTFWWPIADTVISQIEMYNTD